MILSLVVYVGGTIAALANAWLINERPDTGRKCLIALVAVLGSASVLRGYVGTDTLAYEQIISHYLATGDGRGVEPAFLLLWSSLSHLDFTAYQIVRLLSVLYVVTLLIYILLADRRDLFIVAVFLIPSFYFQYSMNGLRVGIAINVFLILSKLRFGSGWWGGLVNFASILFHYSMVLPSIYFGLIQRRFTAVRVFAISAFFMVFTLCVIVFYYDYLLSKFGLYSEVSSPSVLSGAPWIFSLTVLISCVLRSPSELKGRCFLTISGIGALAVAFIAARVSYGGLRVLELLVSIYPFMIAELYRRSGVSFDRVVKIGLVIAGSVSAAFFLRRVFFTPYEGGSPWLPYEAVVWW